MFDPATLSALGSLGGLFGGGKGTEVNVSQSSSNTTQFANSLQISNVLPGGFAGAQQQSTEPDLTTSSTADASSANPTTNAGLGGSVYPDITSGGNIGAGLDSTGQVSGEPSMGIMLAFGIAGAGLIFLMSRPKKKRR